MKGLSVLLCCALFSGISYADTDITPGMLTYLTSPTLDGNVTIQNGGALKLEFSGGGTLSNDMANNGLIGDYSSDTTTLSGVISGTGTMYKGGTGTMVFTGSNTYSGVTYINAGTLQTGAAGVIGQRSAVYVAEGASLDLNNYRQTVGSVSGSGSISLGDNALPSASGLVTGSDGRLTPGANSGFSGVTTSGSVSVGGSTIVSGATVTIAAPNNAGGQLGTSTSSGSGLSLGEGTLSVVSSSAVVSNTQALLGSSSSGSLLINGGTLSMTGIVSSTLTVANASSGTIVNNTSHALIIGGLTLNPGETATMATSGGQLVLSSSNRIIGTVGLSGSTFTVQTATPPPPPPPPAPQLLMSPMFVPQQPTGNGVLITGNDNINRIYSGTISGNGSVIKVGTGAWNLTGANTYTGLTTVADGALFVNGSVAGDVFVWGGVLGGSGTIGGSVLNQSAVSPGNSPGTLTISGTYSQASSGFLLIQIASPTVYDRLSVTGPASLDGGLIFQYLNGFKLQRGETFTFLTAGGGITGQFSQVYFPAGSIMGVNLLQSGDSITMIPVQGSFSRDIPNLTPNQKAVAEAIDRNINNRGMARLVDKLDTYSLAELPNALEKIVPSDLITMFDASIASASVQDDNLERRMAELQGGASGWSTSGLHLANNHGGQSASGDPRQAIGKDGKALGTAALSDRWGFFVNGSGEFVDIESTADARGADFTTGGISAGADYRLGDHAAVGANAGYANTTSDGKGSGSVKINSGKLGLYGTVFGDGFFLNGALGGGLNSYDTKRDTVGGLARGDTEGNDLNALLGGGYTYRSGAWSTGPIASLRYSWVGIDGFRERGSLAPLRYEDQSESSLKSTVGWQTAYAFAVKNTVVTPQIRAQWQHEYGESARGIGASFLPGGSFTVFGPDLGRDSLLLDAGVTVQLNARTGVYAFYTGDLGRANYSAQSINGGVQISF